MPIDYRLRAERFLQQSERLGRRYNQLSLLRLAAFIAAIGLGIYLFASWPVGWGIGFSLVFLVGFYRFVRWHKGIRRQQEHQYRLSQINNWEGAVLQNHQYGHYPDGAEFLDASHPYAADLDLFGPFSIYQYVNRAYTALGQRKLADWLLVPASPEVIAQRQDGVQELSVLLDWRQHLQAYSLATEDSMDQVELLHRWLEAPSYLLDNRAIKWALILIPLWSVVASVLWALYLPWYVALLLYLPNIWLMRRYLERVNRTHQQTTLAEKGLAHYAQLIAPIEKQSFESVFCQHLQQKFTRGPQPASASIKRLSYIISQLNVRYNAFAVVFNVLGLWDLQWVYRLEAWKETARDRLPEWFDAMAEFEALSSLGNLYANNPDWVVPELSNNAQLTAQEMGHPLIDRHHRVNNSIVIPTNGHIKLITGSNMAGKSTFLRTVGINIVLAMAGAPVCAKRLSLPVLQVYTSMRTQDALHESTSSFFAELKRLKVIIHAVEASAGQQYPQPQAFFLLDEILKGTNSKDRHTGSKALIRQLIQSNGSGIIATHDLELGALEAVSDGAVENLRIEVAVEEDGALHFDYKLKKGVSQSFNATTLMRRMGIRVEEA